jgi:hypothetical protein
MTPEELEKLANDQETSQLNAAMSQQRRTFDPPRQTGPLGGLNELMQAMIGIETWKMQILQNDRSREAQIESRLRKQIEEQMTAQIAGPEQMDPGVKMALDILVEAFKSSMTKPNAGPTRALASETVPSMPEPTIVQPVPTTEATIPEGEPVTITQEEAEKIADEIGVRYPVDVKMCQEGRMSEEVAIAKICWGGASRANAKKIYDTIMRTDYEATESDTPV